MKIYKVCSRCRRLQARSWLTRPMWERQGGEHVSAEKCNVWCGGWGGTGIPPLSLDFEWVFSVCFELNAGSLCREEVKAEFQAVLQQKFDESPLTDDPTSNILWKNLKSAILTTSEEVLRHAKKIKDWCNENDKEIQDLLSKKRAAHQAHFAQPTCHVNKAIFRRACSILQRKEREG